MPLFEEGFLEGWAAPTPPAGVGTLTPPAPPTGGTGSKPKADRKPPEWARKLLARMPSGRQIVAFFVWLVLAMLAFLFFRYVVVAPLVHGIAHVWHHFFGSTLAVSPSGAVLNDRVVRWSIGLAAFFIVWYALGHLRGWETKLNNWRATRKGNPPPPNTADTFVPARWQRRLYFVTRYVCIPAIVVFILLASLCDARGVKAQSQTVPASATAVVLASGSSNHAQVVSDQNQANTWLNSATLSGAVWQKITPFRDNLNAQAIQANQAWSRLQYETSRTAVQADLNRIAAAKNAAGIDLSTIRADLPKA